MADKVKQCYKTLWVGYKSCLILVLCLLFGVRSFSQSAIRKDIVLKTNWLSVANDTNINAYNGFEQAAFNTQNWQPVTVPHNWDTYQGYRRLKHGDRHGYAWYRTSFIVKDISADKAYFLFFEGVGSYATVWLNGTKVGYHAGGRTTFTLNVSQYLLKNKPNILAVRADHPDKIQDLPWVCGGSADEVGFSEGSQPMGIYRPVHFIITGAVRIEPFGVHIWNDTTVTEKSADLNIETEVKNYSNKPKKIAVINRLIDERGIVVAEAVSENAIPAGATMVYKQKLNFTHVHLWSLGQPYLYKMVSKVMDGQRQLDQESTPYGIRWISWPIGRGGSNKQFLLNGKPVFINGVAEYEHKMGQSHAFSNAQVRTRVMQVKTAGFNAFRDAHQPHNLAYQQYWDELGILWWPQFTAHIWYDTPAFRENFKTLLADWVKERRNNPSNILWGLQNESRLPADFAAECCELIRKLDPTASSQRKITTCNGGNGTDWDVPQNWTGTYGGNPLTYATDLEKQILVGEYGGWRSIDLHTDGPFAQNGALSEDRLDLLMETKIRLAESVKDKVAGHFQWLLSSHENPGRVQGGEGWREMDRVGPVNYKGLLTPWGEPTDAFYLYRANYAPKDKEPMVYIVSHTWPDRWLSPGTRDSLSVYSNCDEVELFNDVNGQSFGKKKNGGKGTHFTWDRVNVQYNVLYAVGYVKGKKVAEDYIVLNHLPQSPNFQDLNTEGKDLLKPNAGLKYIYRVNCGGPDYTDQFNHVWLADVHQTNNKTWGSTSWTDDLAGMPAMFGSQRRTFDLIKGTTDPQLFQTFRYGLDKLKYDFPVADGDYEVEFYFTEPWYGTGGGMDCTGWRLFDVAVNGHTVINNLDIWKEAGHDRALKKVVKVHVTGGHLTINFPHAESGEAIISAIAIASVNKNVVAALPSASVIHNLVVTNPSQAKNWSAKTWLDVGNKLYTNDETEIAQLPPNLYGAEWIKTPKVTIEGAGALAKFNTTVDADVYIGLDADIKQLPAWLHDYDNTKTLMVNDANGGNKFMLYHKRFKAGAEVSLGYNADKALMYLVAVQPVTEMEPATDLKTTVSYKAETATLSGEGTVISMVNGRNCITFKTTGSGAEWAISTGVAEAHEMRIKYANTTGKTLTANIKLLAADGTVMKEAQLKFGKTEADKFKTVGTTTGTSINAGNYKVILSAVDAEGLIVSGLEVQ
ncbi:glycosyl hydrolase family 2 [Mucilaginibacter gracilis]|uniref:Glycosyl hydrolase family 2 n=2 Tax=Mucilaginibacter gracilis TaxID=423350 RepID=A0A495J6K9_9SPHI|nr:glycosyl hydrolase family 2 [Mucilaginibacter gracilis]